MKSSNPSKNKSSSPPRPPQQQRTEELVLPKAEQTEKEVLGIFLFAPESIQKAIDCGLTSSLFAMQSHQTIFSMMKAIKEKGWEITPKSLEDELKSQHQLDQIGGGAYLGELIDSKVSGPERLAGIIQQLKDIDYKRQAMKKGAELQALAGNGASPAQIEEFLETIPRTHTTVQKYIATPAGIVYRKPAKYGYGFEHEDVTNFVARIHTELNEDDGTVEEQRIFDIEILLNGVVQRIEVPSSKYDSMAWVTSQLGAKAIIWPGKDSHAKTAIKLLSPNITKNTVYAHTGWRKIEDQWCYLHAGGAITANGNRTDISVRLPHMLRFFLLPDPATGDDAIASYQSVLELLDAFPRHLSVPLIGAIFAAVLGVPDYSIYVTGASGSFKSEATGVAQSFFGAGFSRLTMPANWYDTQNVILAKCFILKDALMFVDDFAPTGNKREDDELHGKAAIVFRAAGNRTGRGGLNSDTTIRTTKEPRGLLGASGEDLPRGHSVQNRLFIILVKKGDITSEKLTAMQKMAAQGKFALSMSTFLSQIAPVYSEIQSQFDQDRISYRNKLNTHNTGHSRQPTMTGHIAAAWRVWLKTAVTAQALSKQTATQLWAQIWKSLKDAGIEQKERQGSQHPADHFIDLLRSALIGGRANLQTIEGGQPKEIGQLCGWRDGKPSGECVGWVQDEFLYLEFDNAYGAAHAQGQRNNEGIAVSKRTLKERMDEKGLIKLKETGRGFGCRTPQTRIQAIAISLGLIFPS